MEIITVPDALLERIQAFCDKQDIEPQEFIIDAIITKLEGVHKERRKKPRL